MDTDHEALLNLIKAIRGSLDFTDSAEYLRGDQAPAASRYVLGTNRENLRACLNNHLNELRFAETGENLSRLWTVEGILTEGALHHLYGSSSLEDLCGDADGYETTGTESLLHFLGDALLGLIREDLWREWADSGRTLAETESRIEFFDSIQDAHLELHNSTFPGSIPIAVLDPSMDDIELAAVILSEMPNREEWRKIFHPFLARAIRPSHSAD